MTNQFRIVRYCDDEQFAVEELIKGEWQYCALYRLREPNMMDVRDATFADVESAKRFVERRRAKERERVIVEEA